MPENKDEQLAAAYLQGDAVALETLIKHYLKPIYGFVFRFVGNRSDAEDITQEVFLRVWRSMKKFDLKRSFRPWLYAIAKNVVIDWLRRKKILSAAQLSLTEEDEDLLDNLPDVGPLPDEVLDQQFLAQELDRLLTELPVKYKTVLVLYYQSDFSLPEIAGILKKPLNTVKSWHRRGLLNLRQLVDKNRF
ncbi:MAG: sigma-70 family RNA polymerase sigma factor [Patescibacteria group bacterium]|jgi:RNA polymerase sigma-70 factor (ECF subfamily)